MGGILLSPAIKQRFVGKGEAVVMALSLLAGDRVRFPTPLGRGLTLTTDPRRQHELEEDRLSLRELPPLAWIRARQIMSAGRRSLSRVHSPLLVVQARDDDVIDGRENAKLFQARDGVTWVWWEGAHDVKLSPKSEDAADLVARWIEEVISAWGSGGSKR
jgi:alpha-beta hydrolase superfamily lysophospholipase